jgi:hypothetical protein
VVGAVVQAASAHGAATSRARRFIVIADPQGGRYGGGAPSMLCVE